MSITIRSSVGERADNNQAWVVRNTAIYDRGIVKCRCEGRDEAAAARASCAPVSASYIGDGSLKTGSSQSPDQSLRRCHTLGESQQFLESGIDIEHDLSAAMRAAGKHLVGDARVLQREHSADVRNQFSAVE